MDDNEENSDAQSKATEHSGYEARVKEITAQNGTFDKIGNKITNNKMVEMKKSLDHYNKEFYANIYDESAIQFLAFKQNFYKSLQILLYQVVLIKNDDARDAKLDQIYKWFTERKNFFNILKNITTKTSPIGTTIDPNIEKKIKNEMYMAMNYPTAFEMKNRTLPECVLKTTLDELQRNKIDRDKYINKELNLLSFIEKKLRDYEELIKATLKEDTLSVSTKVSEGVKEQQIPRLSSYVDNVIEPVNTVPYDKKREYKSTYGYYQPHIDYFRLDFEKKIREHKEKEIAEKRYQYEVHKYLLGYGESKGKAVSLINNKLEKKGMIRNISMDNFESRKNIAEKNAKEEDLIKIKAFESKKTGSTELLRKPKSKKISITSTEDNLIHKITSTRNEESKAFDLNRRESEIRAERKSRVDVVMEEIKENDDASNFVDTKNIKNILVANPNYNQKIPGEQFIDLKINRTSFFRDNDDEEIKIYDNCEEFPSDLVAKHRRDSLYNARYLYHSQIESKPVAPKRRLPEAKTLSLFDERNLYLTKNKIFNKDHGLKRNKSTELKSNIFYKQNKGKENDLFEMKTIYSKYLKKKDNYKIKMNLEKESKESIAVSYLDSMLLPPIESKEIKSKFYLPLENGVGLFSNQKV